MSTQQHSTQHEDERLGAYVLGLLDEHEVSAVERHLASCPDCRHELAELREMEQGLGEIPPEAFLDGPPDGGDLLLQRTLRRARKERAAEERQRWGIAGVAAAVAVCVLLGGGVLIGRGTASTSAVAGPPQSGPVSASPSAPPAGTRVGSVTDAATGARMTVSLTPAVGWVRVTAAVAGIPAGQKCRLVVIGRSGAKEIAGSWNVSPAGAKVGTTLDGSAMVPPSDVAAVAVENIQGKRFVTMPLNA